MVVYFKKLTDSALVPARQSDLAAGFDLHSMGDYVIPQGKYIHVATGIACEIPVGAVGLIRPRSGLASRNGIHTLAGVVDADYRGEVIVLLVNLGDTPFEVKVGDRIAQLVVTPVITEAQEVAELSVTARGSLGFGSTD